MYLDDFIMISRPSDAYVYYATIISDSGLSSFDAKPLSESML